MRRALMLVAAALIATAGAVAPFDAAPELLTCPTPTTCPAGFTGSVCEFPLCTQRGFVLPPQYDGAYNIDMDNLASCVNSYVIPVDSMVSSLIVVVSGYNTNLYPLVTVYDQTGTDVTNQMLVTGSSQTWTGTLQNINRKSAYGKYSAVIESKGGPCLYEARALTAMTLSLGYVYGNQYQINDFPTASLPANTVGGIAAHVNGLLRPGFSASMSVYMAPNNVSSLVAQYPVIERFNCANDVYVGPVICTTDATYYFKLAGIDAQGYSFLRTDYLQCSTSTSTTTAPVTTTSMCLNGGYYNTQTQQCECGFYWQGTICQQPVCFNGGTPVQNGCVCPVGYVDVNCLEASCPSPNSNLPAFSPNGRTLALIIQNTVSMASTIGVIQDYISELYYDFQLQYPNYIVNYIVITYNPNGASLLTNTNDPETLFEAVWHISEALVNSTVCNQQFNQAVQMALTQTNPATQMYSDMYIFTNSPPDLSNSQSNLQVYDLLEQTKCSLMFYIEQPTNGFCTPYSGDGFQRYRDLAQFSGGLALLLQQGPTDVQGLQMIPASMQRQQIYQKSFTNCTNPYGVDIYLPVDSHAGSLSVAVQGNLPNIDIYRPDGSRFSAIPLLDDYYTAVRQVISPCPTGWSQYDNKCFSGAFVSIDWYTANINCQAMGGSLMTILNQEKQSLSDRNTGGIDYWIGLNAISPNGTSFSTYSWAVGNNQSIPLGHQYTNWAPGYPTTDPNAVCVVMKHNVTTGKGYWYNVNCYMTYNYVCEMHTYNNESPYFPPGIYRVNFQSQPQQPNDPVGAYGNNCLVTVNAQSDMQLFYGYNTGSDSLTNDFPTYEPSTGSTTNRFVANFTNFDETLSSVNMLEFYDVNYNLLQAQWFTHRTSPCAYRYVSDVFTCPVNSFATVVTGTDNRGYTFNRYDWGLCLGTSLREKFA